MKSEVGHDSHGAYLCHKCGWPFPNPHPSAKHRRAHKKICGKIEGYMLTGAEGSNHSSVSDDVNISEKDGRTPSPKVVRKSIEGSDSGGISVKSGISEDDVFSDAVSEFSGGGFNPLIKDDGGRKQLDENMAKVVVGDPNASHSWKGNTIADPAEPVTITTERSLIYNYGALECTEYQSCHTTPFEDTVTGEHMGGLKDLNASRILSPVKFEALPEIAETSEHSSDILADCQDETIVQSEEQNYDLSGPKNSTPNNPPELDRVEQTGLVAASIDITQIKPDCSKDIDAGTQGDLLQMLDMATEGKEDTDVLFVSNLPMAGTFSMTEGFKDHNKLNSAELITFVEKDGKDTIVEMDHSGSHSADACGKDDTHSGTVGDLLQMSGMETEGKEDTITVSVSNLLVANDPSMIEGFKDQNALKSEFPVTLAGAETITSAKDEDKDATVEKNNPGSDSGKEDTITVSVSNLPMANDPCMIEGFKDRNVLKSKFPVTLDDAEIITSAKDEDKDVIGEKNYPGSDSENAGGKKDVHAISLTDLALSDNPESMIEGFKDHNKLKSEFPVSLDCAELIQSVEADGKTADGKGCTDSSSGEAGQSTCGYSVIIGMAEDAPKLIGQDKMPEADASESNTTCGKDDVHVVSLADFALSDDHESMIEGFKDHNKLKSKFPVSQDSAEVIQSVEVDGKKADEKGHSDSPSGEAGESTCGYSVNTAVAEDASEPIGGAKMPESDAFESNTTGGALEFKQLDTSFDTSSNDVQEFQNDQYPEGLHTSMFENKPSRDAVLQSCKVGLPDVISMANSTDDEFKTDVKLSGNDADNCVLNGIIDAASEIESKEGIMVEKTLNAKMSSEAGESLSSSKVEGVSILHEVDDAENLKIARDEPSEVIDDKSTETSVVGDTSQLSMNKGVVTDVQGWELTHLGTVSDPMIADISSSVMLSIKQCDSNLQKCFDEDSQGVSKELKVSNGPKVQTDSVGVAGYGNRGEDVKLPNENLEKGILKYPGTLPANSEFPGKSSFTIEDSHGTNATAPSSDPLQEESDSKFIKQHGSISPVDVSIDSCSQTDSLEGHWGSVSVLSTQSDAPAVVDVEALPATDSSQTFETSEANFQRPKTAPEGHGSGKSDVFEPPSFMTLVEPGSMVNQKSAPSEIETTQSNRLEMTEGLKAGWFPSLTNVVNESQGRKKNEEIIEKVTNWSAGKQPSPLKTLLGEEIKPNHPNLKQIPSVTQKDESTASDNNKGRVTTVNSILVDTSTEQAAADNRGETGKEWNSPARYPTDNKKQKRKVKGKQYWVPFVCCSSVN